ncbi:hypothetical protein C7H19_20600 [Aphanothece hegewaldii CCALA 016]|uniref:Transcriptional regulator n=1 Tax=Aphanothece hegewaldii CCALA 016 TaxID=2107694 RepID=A0A2T1LST6_9CHRO|nr:response regulator [Aphanothece hegewaldii]PSF33096.1 hypothetical protein C7H19_20600 [Aphanothece hegewaldii CCALA 016]
MKILLLEQDQYFATQVQNDLLSQGCIIDIAIDWEICWQLAELFDYDLILIDLVRLDPNGIKFCQQRRLTGDTTPIIIIGIQDSSTYQNSALQVGATDYLTKPVAIDVLLARIQALTSDNLYNHPSVIEWQGIRLNFLDCQATYNNHPLYLNQTELTLLALFVKNYEINSNPRIFTLRSILDNLWGFENKVTEKDLEKHIQQLQQKLQQAGASVGIIENIYGLGYRLKITEITTEARDNVTTSSQPLAKREISVSEKVSPVVSVRSLSPHSGIKSPRLLIIDHDRQNTKLLTLEAKSWGIEAQAVQNVTEARIAIALHCPDIVLLDLPIADTSENELHLLSELSQANPPIPVLVSTATESFTERLKVAKMGGQGFLHKPISPDLVMESVTHLLQHKAPPVGTLMIVGADSAMLDLFSNLLSPWGFQLIFLRNPQQFWDTLEQSNPDLLILDFELPNISGIELCQIVRQDPQWNDLPILMLSAEREANTVQKVFEAGADDFIHKPIVGPELIARILNRLERINKQRRLSNTDGLTRIANRRKAVQEIERLIRIANRQQKSLCFALLDLDHFKDINDRHGHEIGDQVLKKLGELLKQHFREEDVVCRWGGEEFALCLFGMEKKQAIDRLNAFLAIWRQQIFIGKNQESFRITFSAGIAQYPTDGQDLQSLYQAADTLLYLAKEKGRDRVLSQNIS